MAYDAAGAGIPQAANRARSNSGSYDTAGIPQTANNARARSGGYDEIGSVNTKDPNTEIAAPEGQSNVKTINEPKTVAQATVEPQGELIRYPLISNNYFASMTFRMKTINPWDIDLNIAKSVYESSLLYEFVKNFKKPEEPDQAKQSSGTTGSTYDEAGVGIPDAPVQNPDALDPRGNQIGPTNTERLKAREKQESQATKGQLGISTSYVPNADQISLYMPMAINIMDNVSYDTPELGARGAGVLAAVNNAGTLSAAASEALRQTFAPLTDIFNSELTGQAARLALSRAASAFAPSDLAAAAQIGLQVKVNPNQRSIFGGVTIRQFTFQYDFVATNPTEANQINKIIKHFRRELYPATFGREETSIPLGYKFPNLFEIKFRWGNEAAPMPQPLLCYLRDVQTTYNPGNMAFHADGNATHIQMTLQFQEFRALTREDVEKGH